MTCKEAAYLAAMDSKKYKEVADYLATVRHRRRLSLQKLAQITTLPVSTIRELEQPEKSTIPSSHVVGLYHTYARALTVPAEKVDELIADTPQAQTTFRITRLPKLRSMVVFSNWGSRLTVLAVLLMIAGYALWQVLSLQAKPTLSVSSPAEAHMVVHEPIFTISGTSKPETTVLLNGEPLSLSGEGARFSQDIHLLEGVNSIQLEASNNFMRKTERDYTIVYVP